MGGIHLKFCLMYYGTYFFLYIFLIPYPINYAVGSNVIPKGSKFRNNLSQQQINQSPQFFQFWIANAMVNSYMHAYYIMLITFFFLKYFVIFSHFPYILYIFGIQMSTYVFIVLSMHRTVVIDAMEIVSKFQALLSIRY